MLSPMPGIREICGLQRCIEGDFDAITVRRQAPIRFFDMKIYWIMYFLVRTRIPAKIQVILNILRQYLIFMDICGQHRRKMLNRQQRNDGFGTMQS
ncbi:hypothetical protein [Herminiimonas sp. CN]|uniref:hypothetical protein n=1 Tax=Herminiimonas sp. CN TaxID=1349818 RepID=UPI0012DCD338|nr:hypothetical protein [Herminiimonas sp. CN]